MILLKKESMSDCWMPFLLRVCIYDLEDVSGTWNELCACSEGMELNKIPKLTIIEFTRQAAWGQN